MGEHQLTIRDYLRHANLTVTNKYLQATATSKRRAQDKLEKRRERRHSGGLPIATGLALLWRLSIRASEGTIP